MKLEQFNCELTYTNPVYHGNGTICGCCGSNVVTSNPDDRLLRDFNVSALRNDGISIWPSKTAVTEETDEYWCESIPVGNEFLVVKHRKVTCPEDDYYNEDETMSNSVPGAQNSVREPVINFVYFRDTYNWDAEFYGYYYGDSGRASLENDFAYFLKGYQNKQYKWATRGDIFATKLVPGTYYFYIITPHLENMFRKEMANRGYDKWIVWDSREYAENYNYPGEARLKAVMLKCPDDFKPVNSTEK